MNPGARLIWKRDINPFTARNEDEKMCTCRSRCPVSNMVFVGLRMGFFKLFTQTQWQCSQCTHRLTLQCTLVCTGTYTTVHWYYTLVDQCTILLSQCRIHWVYTRELSVRQCKTTLVLHWALCSVHPMLILVWYRGHKSPPPPISYHDLFL